MHNPCGLCTENFAPAGSRREVKSLKRVSFIRQSLLRDVAGRIDYISNPTRQEHLYATYETNPEPFWDDLAKENQVEFFHSGRDGQCVEARELIIALPEQLMKLDPDALLKFFTEYFKRRYGVECSAALHQNKSMTNYHIHLVYSERKLRDEPVVKIASRNRYYDENGRHVRTKKEVSDENGNLRPGCRVIPKGEPYEHHMFENKIELFRKKTFLKEVKESYTDLMNRFLRDEEKMMVFPQNDLYLPTKKIGKNNPLADEIAADNRSRDVWNESVRTAIEHEVPEKMIRSVKMVQIRDPIARNIYVKGKSHQSFRKIVERAAATVRTVTTAWHQMTSEQRVKAVGEKMADFLEFCSAKASKLAEKQKIR